MYFSLLHNRLDPTQPCIDWPEKSHLNKFDTSINSVLEKKVYIFSKKYLLNNFPFSHSYVLIYLPLSMASLGLRKSQW